MKDGLRMRLGAVVLALLTVSAVVLAILNFQQRSRFITPDDGVSWTNTSQGVSAWYVSPDSPAAKAGIKPGDIMEAVNGSAIHDASQVTQHLWRLGTWMEARYRIHRAGGSFETKLITVPAEKPAALWNYLSVVALLYLFIGLFIFVRRWSAARAVHFYLFCLLSFILYSFHYTGKLNAFDWTIYWSNVAAWLLQPALLVHFALVFPERRGRLGPKLLSVYILPAILLFLHVSVATQFLDFLPSLESRNLLDQYDLGYMALYFLLAAEIFLLSYRRAPSGVLRQQLKWVTIGTWAGILPFSLFYVVPFLAGRVPQGWMNISVFSLALIPLCFGYAIIRYRLMDVDIIFKRGLAYTFATASVIGIYFGSIALIGELFHSAWPSGMMGGVIAIVVAAFLFQPFRDWIQARLDHFFYRDRLNYRRTLIEFGRALTSEVRLDPMLASVMDRISQALLVDRLAIFVEEETHPGTYRLARSIGVRYAGPLDLSFLDAEKNPFPHRVLFTESAPAPRESTPSGRPTRDQHHFDSFLSS